MLVAGTEGFRTRATQKRKPETPFSGAARMAVAGHRGSSAIAPENTLAANRLAFEQGADGVEFDVLMSADGEVFLLHDSTLRKTAGGSCPRELCVDGNMTESEYSSMLDRDVATLSYWNFIRYVEVGSWKGAEYAGERPALLREAMAEIPTGKLVLCELKGSSAEAGRAVVQLAATEGWSPSTFKVIGFDLGLMAQIKRDFVARGMQNKVWFLKSAWFPWTARSAISDAQSNGLDGVNWMALSIAVSTSVVSAAKAANLEVGVWISKSLPFVDMDTPSNAATMEGRGVDVFTSDLATTMVEWVAGRR